MFAQFNELGEAGCDRYISQPGMQKRKLEEIKLFQTGCVSVLVSALPRPHAKMRFSELPVLSVLLLSCLLAVVGGEN